jgi:HEAT repeat protein
LMALGRIKSPRALDLLITCATSKPYSYNNIKAIEALSFYEKADPRLFEIYDMALTEAKTPTDQAKTFNSPYAIRVASDGLARIKSDASLRILITHLDLGKWENGPTYLVKAIERFGKPAVPAVLDLVRNTSASQFARQNAVQALGLLRASETRSDVIALLDSPDLHQPAAQALATWGKMDTIPDLQAAMQRHPEWGWDFDNAIQRIKR